MKHSVPGEIFIVVQSTMVAGSGVRGDSWAEDHTTGRLEWFLSYI